MASDRGGDGGWRRRRRRVRGHPIPTDSVDAHIGVGYGEGHSFSSDYDLKDSDTSGRNKVLEDAFFGFFKKRAVRSLKRNFADACNDIPELAEVKKSKGDGVGCSVFTRFGPKYFIEVLKNLTSDQRAVIENFGFGCLLLFDCGYIPSSFARWVADRIDPLCSHITVCGKPFIISNETFHIVLGLPIGGMQIHLNSDDGRNFILSHFQLSDIPHITFFGNKLSGPDILSELDVFICFITVALSCLLCPVVSHSVNFSCLAMLKDPASVKSYDFSRLVYEHCMNSLIEYSSFGKSRGRRMKLPVCCNYVLVVRYLDFLDFGIQNVDQATPRVNVWKGNMIKLYSDFDFKSRHVFGKKQLKGDFACGRLQGFDALMKSIIPFKLSPLSSDFKIGVHSQFAKSLQAEVIDGIVNIADKFVNNPEASKPKICLLVSNVLEFLCNSSRTHRESETMFKQQHQNLFSNVNMYHNLCTVEIQDLKEESPHARVDPLKADPETPECMITKVLKRESVMSAPTMKPIKKVKARTCPVMSEEGEAQLFSRRLYVQSSGETKVGGTCERNNVVITNEAQTGNFKLRKLPKSIGSMEEPIKVPDMSPNVPMDENHVGVQLVGSTEFGRRQKQLSKITDNTYNSLILPKQPVVNANHIKQGNRMDGLAQGNNNQDPVSYVCPVRRKHRFVNWLVTGQSPPLQLNVSYPVSQEQIIDYSAIVELAHSKHMKSSGLLYQKVHCSYKSVGDSLMPNGEIDNIMIPCFCRMLFEEKHPSSSGRHYFFPHIGEAILKFDGGDFHVSTVRTSFEGAAKASKGRKLGHKDNRLFFPIVESGHWFAFVVDFECKVFAFLDSFYDSKSDFHMRIKDRLIDNFVHLWEIIISDNNIFDKFQVLYPSVPKQQNLKDCGVFMMKFMEDWKPSVDMRSVFTYHDILNLRILYANRLFFFSQNEADVSLVTNFYSEG